MSLTRAFSNLTKAFGQEKNVPSEVKTKITQWLTSLAGADIVNSATPDLSMPTGDLAEKTAQEYLSQRGLVFLSQNFRSKFGEIDLVMQDNTVLVFIEVRFRKNNHYGSALDSVTPSKQKKIRLTAQYYLVKHNIKSSQAARFDVVGMMPGDIQWIKNAF